jgi:hypothetical protein
MSLTTAGLELRHGAFAKPPLHIPNAAGEPYKTELVEVRTDDQTIKWNFWHAPDDARAPHNHPWAFVAEVRHGGYTERRYWLADGEVKSEVRTYRAGDCNTVPQTVFHTVVAVLPGTVTRMVCGPAAPDNEWGYLDVVTGQYTRAEPDRGFLERLRSNNRFLIPKL